jgi:hypothetical protein
MSGREYSGIAILLACILIELAVIAWHVIGISGWLKPAAAPDDGSPRTPYLGVPSSKDADVSPGFPRTCTSAACPVDGEHLWHTVPDRSPLPLHHVHRHVHGICGGAHIHHHEHAAGAESHAGHWHTPAQQADLDRAEAAQRGDDLPAARYPASPFLPRMDGKLEARYQEWLDRQERQGEMNDRWRGDTL